MEIDKLAKALLNDEIKIIKPIGDVYIMSIQVEYESSNQNLDQITLQCLTNNFGGGTKIGKKYSIVEVQDETN